MQKPKKQRLPVLAIDLGGTKINAAIISSKGQIRAKEYRLTLANKGPEIVISRIFSAIDHLLKTENINITQLDSISIAAAGAIDINRGLVTASPNLPDWCDIALRDILKEKYGINTILLNDASAAALGEHHFGAGKGVSNLVLLTLGTGIGGGIIIDDKLYSGVNGSAGEIGHMTIDINGIIDTCGNVGCLETLASGTAIAREVMRRVRQGEKTSLTEIVKDKIENITAEKVEIAARGGDPLAMEVISQAGTYLGVGLVNVVNIFNPEMIIIGGGVAKMADLLLNPARQIVRERAFQLAVGAVRVVPAQLGNDAGILGAAVFAFQQETD
jgi:glucokinase